MERIDTIDNNKNLCYFQYTVKYGDNLNQSKVYFKVYSIPENPLRWFSYNCKIINDNIAKNEMISNNGFVEFAKKGIPERIIEIASTILKRNIISSPIYQPIQNSDEYLVIPAYKAWERLVSKNENAFLDIHNNYFILNYIS